MTDVRVRPGMPHVHRQFLPDHKQIAIVEVRGIKSRAGWSRTRVSVQVVPAGVQPLRRLDPRTAARRGITLIPIAEGYQPCRTVGPRHWYTRAIAEATSIARQYTDC